MVNNLKAEDQIIADKIWNNEYDKHLLKNYIKKKANT